jgi:hypothetical protein
MVFYSTKFNLSEYNGSWIVSMKQNMNFITFNRPPRWYSKFDGHTWTGESFSAAILVLLKLRDW